MERSLAHQGTFRSRDGTPIYYEVQGQGKPLILCYGLLCRREHWRHQVRHFSPNYQVITWDYRGHPRSGTPANDQHLTVQWCASDLEDLASNLGLEQVCIFGHSLGVAVVTEAVARGKIQASGLVLICGAVQNPFERMFFTNRMEAVFEVFGRVYEKAPRFAEKVWSWLVAEGTFSYLLTAGLGFNPKYSDRQDVQSYLDGVRRGTVHNFYRLLLDYVHFDGRPNLAQIQVPTLVLAGQDDLITPLETQQELVSLLGQGRLQLVPAGSHNSHTDQPERVNQWISEFLNALGYC